MGSDHDERASSRIAATRPREWGLIAFFSVVPAAMVALPLFVSPTTFVFVVAAIGAALIAALVWLFGDSYSIVLGESGIEHRARWKVTRVPWGEVERLEARLIPIGSRTVTQYVAVHRGGQIVFTDDWTNFREVAASIQAGRLDPSAVLDLELALGVPAFPPPADALGIDETKIVRFFGAVERALARARIDARVDRLRLRAISSTSRTTYELLAIGRTCARSPVEHWDELLGKYFDDVVRNHAAAEEILGSATSYEAVRSKLRLQLAPKGGTKGSVGHDLSGHLRAFVVLSIEGREVVLPKSKLEEWGVTKKKVLAAARKGLAALPQPTQTTAHGTAIFEGDEFTAARVLILPQVVDVDPRLGAIVALPSQSTLAVMPVHDMSAVVSLMDHRLALSARATWGSAPRPLSRDLFWWHDGELERIPQLSGPDGHLTYVVPDALSGRLTGRLP